MGPSKRIRAQSDGIAPDDLRALARIIRPGSAVVGIWPADLFALEGAGWSEAEAQQARATGAVWFVEVAGPGRGARPSSLYALTSSGWKEVG